MPTEMPGTINTIVVTNATLSAAALVEAHALAVEAKCAACTELGLACAKSGRPAQGTFKDFARSGVSVAGRGGPSSRCYTPKRFCRSSANTQPGLQWRTKN